MPTETTAPSGPQITTETSDDAGTGSRDGSGIANNRTLVISLSTVLSTVGLVLIVGGVWICWRRRRRRLPFFPRGVSPIDDDEIATWKTPRDEKTGLSAGDTDVEVDGGVNKGIGGQSHTKHASTSSVKKPPSVIVYTNSQTQGYRQSTDGESRRSFAQNHTAYGKTSFEKALPQAPIQAKAPNARVGLTDESVPGDEPFLPSPKRHPSRLSKLPPNSAPTRRSGAHHVRARSSRSSARNFGECGDGDGDGDGAGGAATANSVSGGSDAELSPRHSHDCVHMRHSRSYRRGKHHSRIYSSSSVPPRLSLGDEARLNGVSPGRPPVREDEIGRAIG